jgi:hypothetical protein
VAGVLLAVPFASPARAAGRPGAAAPLASVSSPSDVEAAAFTLGALTLGGLAMRAVVAARRDPEAEKRAVENECERLRVQEAERMRRAARRRMKEVESGIDDETLMSEFQSAIARLSDGGDSESFGEAFDLDDDGGDADVDISKKGPGKGKGKRGAAASGAGSMVLERPGEGADEKGNDEEDNIDGGSLDGPSAESLDLLKRMWNLSSDDDSRV